MGRDGSKRIEYHTTRAFAREEPRIELVEAMLKSVLAVAELECEGHPVRVDGFRLRDAEDWRTVREATLQQNLGSLSAACNCHCTFCYEDGNPDGLFENEPRFVSLQEASARSALVHDGRGLMRETKSFFEPLANPRFVDLLRVIRAHDPDQVIDITTNGARLSADLVAQLAELQPVYVNVSLISANVSARRRLMRDPNPRTAIEAIKHLREYEVPFMGTLVPMPDQGLEDVTETIEYLDAYDARLIRAAPPGLSRHHPENRPGLIEDWTPTLIEHVLRLREHLTTPVILSPFGSASTSVEPIVEGVIRNSPAASAGASPGDQVATVNGKRTVSRAHASALLRRAMRKGVVEVELQHGSETLALRLEEPEIEVDAYPHKPRGYRPLDFAGMSFGLILPGSFHLEYIRQIHAAMVGRGAQRGLVIASTFYRELVENLLRELPLPAAASLEVIVPANEFFGGSVNVGDLWVLDDIERAVRRYTADSGKPDLILMPSSFLSRWGRDLRGVPYTEMEARLGIDVVLVKCERVVM